MPKKPYKPRDYMPSKEEVAKFISTPMDDDLTITPDMKDKVDELVKYFDEVGISYDKFSPDDIPTFKIKAYPNYDQYMHVPGQHNTQKWLQAIKEVYWKEKNGINRANAIRQVTSGWHLMETYDFLNWLRFYEEGAHLKYKYAQLWYENGAPGYFLHVKQDAPKAPEPAIVGHDIDEARDSIASEMSLSEKKHIIEKQRQKIIGRLDSAEKLLRSHEGQIFAGKELESLMEAIYSLKKKVQLVNKLSTSTRLYEDMIVREGNILTRAGFVKAANLLYSIAEEPAPLPAPPAPPQQGSGSAGGLPSVGPGMPQNPPESAPNDNSPVPKGIAGFLENLDTAKVTTKEDKQDIDDDLEVNDELLITEAQEAPPAKPLTPEEPPATEEPLEVKENETVDPEGADKPSPVAQDFDRIIDSAFANLKIDDVVAKLEDLAKVFKTREIPRQLAIVDMMLDSLGLAAFFPSLSEATNKALESNNYISTRVEDILSKLRGSIKTNEIDLKGGQTPEKPEIAAVKNKLQQDAEKEKARKEMRKQQEAAELEGGAKESPEIDIKEDLGAPTAPATPPATPQAPPKPPV